MNYTQPQFVKFNTNEALPENVQNKYFFYYALDGFETTNAGIPALYIELKSVYKFNSFIEEINNNHDLIFSGTDYFILNEDYYLNECLQENCLPVYWLNNDINLEYFEYIRNLDFLLDTLIKENSTLELVFDIEALNDFYKTFCLLILNLTTYYDRTLPIDQIYEIVLNYFVNYKTDNTAIGLSLILNNLYSVKTETLTCGCQNSTVGGGNGLGNSDIMCAASCFDYYNNAMNEYIKTMLGDYTFYQRWFTTVDEEINYKTINTGLVNTLIKFINEFISLGYDLSLNNKTKSDCNCPVIDTSTSDCNYRILNNYLNVLNWILNDEIEENTNKIKIYGEQFGELLPKLQF